MLKVLVTEKISEAGLDVLRQDPEVQLFVKTGLSREELLAEVRDVDGMITRSGTPLDPEVLDAAKRLRAAARAGVGLDNIDLAEASRKGVVVINAPTGNTLAATEHTMAMMLSMVRKVPQAFQSLASGEWKRSRFLGRQLSGKRLLVVGLGRIGTQVAARCRAFGMEVSAYDLPGQGRQGRRPPDGRPQGRPFPGRRGHPACPPDGRDTGYHRRGGYKSLQAGGLPGQLRQGRARG